MKMEEVKNFHCPECHTEIGQYLPANTSIVQAVADREETVGRYLQRWLQRWSVVGLVVCILGLFQPVHTWLHAHLELLLGFLLGTLAQTVPWLIERWRWVKWFSHQ